VVILILTGKTMRRFDSIGLRAGLLIAAALAATPAIAQTPTGLPGGATSLRETFDDWSVACAVEQSHKTCVMQQGLRQQNNQRVLAVELRPSAAGVEGTMVLLFGLALAKGATIQIDDGAALAPFPIRTCLPAGCIALLTFDAKALASLRKATALKVKVTPDGGDTETQWSVSLKGFGTALDRVTALLK
jgi:invasion protein IalB